MEKRRNEVVTKKVIKLITDFIKVFLFIRIPKHNKFQSPYKRK
jgi:hypothetical protein